VTPGAHGEGKGRARGFTIRRRLALALAVALLPVLALGALQAWDGFNEDTAERRAALIAEAEGAALLARARMESATLLLEALAPDTLGVNCLARLRAVRERLPAYENLIRFTPSGRVTCAAAEVPADPNRGQSALFRKLAAGERLEITSRPAGGAGREAALVAAIRDEDEAGRFTGVLVAEIRLSSLRPQLEEAFLPHGTAVALTDRDGRLLTVTNPGAFAQAPTGWIGAAMREGAKLYEGRSQSGERRVFAAARLVDDDVFVLLSAPDPGLFSWARLDPMSSVILPLLAFIAAFAAVALATERLVVRWLTYLDRIAHMYAAGRFSVRPVQVEGAPPEIRALARTLDEMGQAIDARDHALRDNLAQKDALLREIHHRVKNNLQVITSLLNLQQRQLSDPAAKAAMADTRQRVTALALVYRALYQSPDLRRVEVRGFLEELVAQLLNGEGPRAQPVRTEITSDTLSLDPDKLAPFALFAVEAVTNALKHGFPERGGRIAIRFMVRTERRGWRSRTTGSAGRRTLRPPAWAAP
jgi:two-component sensor histidine kinase